jgi:putative peptide zinc metalloprotease protein
MLPAGSWVHPKQSMGTLIDPSSWVADIWVEEADVARLHVGDSADVRVLRSVLHKYPGRVALIEASRASFLPHAMLDAQNGGPIPTLPGDKHMPAAGLYKVRVALQDNPELRQMMLGQAIIRTAPEALLPGFLNRVLAVIVRESGF